LHRLNWVSHDLIMTWLHIIWYRDLCNHRDRIWWFGIAFHITWYYYCLSVATISKFWHRVYGIVIWVCICIFYCITLHVIWDRMAYYTMLLWHAIGHHFWLMAHHAVMHLFIICIILYCIIHDRIIACHWLSFVGIL